MLYKVLTQVIDEIGFIAAPFQELVALNAHSMQPSWTPDIAVGEKVQNIGPHFCQ